MFFPNTITSMINDYRKTFICYVEVDYVVFCNKTNFLIINNYSPNNHSDYLKVASLFNNFMMEITKL